MSKKNKKTRETTIENYYDLHVDKVNELVAALKDEDYQPTDEISMNISDCTGIDDPKNVTKMGKQKKFDPYKTDFLGKIPTWIKAIFIKWWFAGAVCYFVMWGLSTGDPLDRAFICGAVMGLVTDILVNPLFRYMETDRKEYNAYMMFPFPFKAFWTFFTNIIYYIIVIAGVNGLYILLNYVIISATGTESVFGAVEPLLFGVFAVLVDMACIGIKDAIVYLAKRTKKKEKVENV